MGGTIVGVVSVAFSIVLQLLGGNAQDAAEDANRPKRVGFCVPEQNENVNGNDVAVVAKK